MTHVINDNASCATKARIGEAVTLINYAPNGRSALVRTADGRKEYLPTRWLSEAACAGNAQTCAEDTKETTT